MCINFNTKRGTEVLQRGGRGGGQMHNIKLGVGVINFDGNFSRLVIQSTKAPYHFLFHNIVVLLPESY